MVGDALRIFNARSLMVSTFYFLVHFLCLPKDKPLILRQVVH